MPTQIQILSYSTSGLAPDVERTLTDTFAPATLAIQCVPVYFRPKEDAVALAQAIAERETVLAPELAVQLPEATALARALAEEIQHRRKEARLPAPTFFDVWLPRQASWFRRYACPNVACDVRYWQAETYRFAIRLQALELRGRANAAGLVDPGGRPWVARCPLCGQLLWPKCIIDIYDDDAED
jgi:hypothetical protein